MGDTNSDKTFPDIVPAASNDNFGARVLEGYVTRKQLSQELNVTERTIQRWNAARIGPRPTHIGRTTIYSVKAVRAWLESREQPQPRRR